MIITSHMSDRSKAAAMLSRRPLWLLALLPAAISLVIPATAWGDIYKWTDEQGRTYYSDSLPPASGKAKNVVVVEKEVKPTPTEQALLARIEALERQQQAMQNAAQTPAVPPPTPYASYYPPAPPPAPPPPPPSYYDSGYDTGYDSGYDSGYYSSGYYPSYPIYYYPVTSSYAVYPARAYRTRPAFAAPHGGFSRGGGRHVGGGVRGGGEGHSGGRGGGQR